MEHLEVDLPATGASEEEVERNNVEEDVAGDKVERGVKSVKPIGAEIWAGKVLELVLEVASRQIRLAPAWVWRELCKIFDSTYIQINSFHYDMFILASCSFILLLWTKFIPASGREEREWSSDYTTQWLGAPRGHFILSPNTRAVD